MGLSSSVSVPESESVTKPMCAHMCIGHGIEGRRYASSGPLRPIAQTMDLRIINMRPDPAHGWPCGGRPAWRSWLGRRSAAEWWSHPPDTGNRSRWRRNPHGPRHLTDTAMRDPPPPRTQPPTPNPNRPALLHCPQPTISGDGGTESLGAMRLNSGVPQPHLLIDVTPFPDRNNNTSEGPARRSLVRLGVRWGADGHLP